MNYQLINLQKMSLAAWQAYGSKHPITVKIGKEIARVRAASEDSYLRTPKINTPSKK